MTRIKRINTDLFHLLGFTASWFTVCWVGTYFFKLTTPLWSFEILCGSLCNSYKTMNHKEY